MKEFGISLSLTAAVTLAVAPASAACVRPDSLTLLGTDIAGPPQIKAEPFSFGGQQLQWIAVSWEGPEDGRLFVTDCDGRRLASLDKLGYAKGLKLGPNLQGKPTLEVSYVPASGPNMRELSVALVQFGGSAISTLWSHSTFDGSYPPALLGPEQEFTYVWRFRNRNTRIEVRGTETSGYKTLQTRSRPTENYCLRHNAAKYVPCE